MHIARAYDQTEMQTKRVSIFVFQSKEKKIVLAVTATTTTTTKNTEYKEMNDMVRHNNETKKK